VSGHGGIIVLNRKGEFGIFHNTPKMAWGVRSGILDVVGVEKH
jgi:beta-aspartyl-peptidase (threonine type)